MPVLSNDEERFLRRLVEFAGSPETLEDALLSLRAEKASPPSLEELLQRILELKERKSRAATELAAAAR